MTRRLAVILGIACMALAGFMASDAHVEFVPVGSALTCNNSGVPGSYPASGAFGTSIVSGDITITTSRVATPGGGEWDEFFIKTNGGASISNTTGYWAVSLSYVLNQNVNFNGVENQFAYNGTPVGSGSVTPFSATITPSIATNWLQIYMNPWSYYSSAYNFSNANEFNFALHFDPLTPVPEPRAIVLVALGLIGLAALRMKSGTD